MRNIDFERRGLGFATATLVLLAGCATAEPPAPDLGVWVGASEVDVLRTWGPPTRVVEQDGRRFLAYTSQRHYVLPGAGGGGAVVSRPSINVAMSCTTTFELQDAVVRSWALEGNDCSRRRAAPAASRD